MNVLWQELYQDALVELDRDKLGQKIEAAHAAMRQRMEELRNSDAGSLDEQRDIGVALDTLRALQRAELKSPAQCSGQVQRVAEEAI